MPPHDEQPRLLEDVDLGEPQKFVSDLAGFDPLRHDGKIVSVVPTVVSWLATRPDVVRTATPQEVFSALPQFQAEKARLRRVWGEMLPWSDLVLAAIRIFEKL